MPSPQELAQALQAATPEAQQQYLQWAIQNNVPQSNDYDMQGFYGGLMNMDPRAASAINTNDQQMHFPDKWKLPNHPTFSTESQYYDPRTMPQTPTWSGGALPNGGESWTLRRPNGGIVAAEAPWYQGGQK